MCRDKINPRTTRYTTYDKCDPGKGMVQKINQVLYERQSTVLIGGIKKKTDNKRSNSDVRVCNMTSHNRGREELSPFSFLSCSENQLGGWDDFSSSWVEDYSCVFFGDCDILQKAKSSIASITTRSLNTECKRIHSSGICSCHEEHLKSLSVQSKFLDVTDLESQNRTELCLVYQLVSIPSYYVLVRTHSPHPWIWRDGNTRPMQDAPFAATLIQLINLNKTKWLTGP